MQPPHAVLAVDAVLRALSRGPSTAMLRVASAVRGALPRAVLGIEQALGLGGDALLAQPRHGPVAELLALGVDGPPGDAGVALAAA